MALLCNLKPKICSSKTLGPTLLREGQLILNRNIRLDEIRLRLTTMVNDKRQF